MTQLVLTLAPNQGEAEVTSVREHARFSLALPSAEILVLGGILGLFQILDGVLTAIGVSTFGLHAEANLFIRHAMETVGTIPALVALKALALIIIAALCVMAHRVRWLKIAMRGVAALYLVAAIIPWTMILAMRFLA